MPRVKSDFKPAWWLRGPNQQTMWSVFFRKPASLDLIPERLELDDGDFLDLVWTGSGTGKTVLILHGLEGNKDSPYANGMLKALSDSGYHCCLMHFRGCSGEPNRLPRSYHSGETGDLQQVINHINVHHQKEVFAAIGYSLGGNVLLKWLGEKRDHAALNTAVAVSVPFSLDDAARRMGKGFSRVYEKHLVSKLQEKYRQKFVKIASPLNVDIDQLNSFYLFDDQVTAPLHGFHGVDDYYARSSCGQFLKQITKPTLILHASDDPFMWPDTAPLESDLSPTVRLEVSEKGGHVGFVSGTWPWKPEYWLEKRILLWLASHYS